MPKAKVTLDTLFKELKKIEAKNDDRHELVKTEFENVNSRFNEMGGRLDSVEGRMNKMDGRFDRIDGRLESIWVKLD